MMAKGQQTINVQHTYQSTTSTSHNTSSYTVLYYGYLKTPSGFIKLGQLICCIAIVTLLGIVHSGRRNYYLGEAYHLFFFTVAVAFLILTFCILLSYTLSLSTYHGLGQKTNYEMIFNVVGFLLFLISTIIYFVYLDDYNYSRSEYNMLSISGYCGGALAILYLINAIMSR